MLFYCLLIMTIFGKIAEDYNNSTFAKSALFQNLYFTMWKIRIFRYLEKKITIESQRKKNSTSWIILPDSKNEGKPTSNKTLTMS